MEYDDTEKHSGNSSLEDEQHVQHIDERPDPAVSSEIIDRNQTLQTPIVDEHINVESPATPLAAKPLKRGLSDANELPEFSDKDSYSLDEEDMSLLAENEKELGLSYRLPSKKLKRTIKRAKSSGPATADLTSTDALFEYGSSDITGKREDRFDQDQEVSEAELLDLLSDTDLRPPTSRAHDLDISSDEDPIENDLFNENGRLAMYGQEDRQSRYIEDVRDAAAISHRASAATKPKNLSSRLHRANKEYDGSAAGQQSRYHSVGGRRASDEEEDNIDDFIEEDTHDRPSSARRRQSRYDNLHSDSLLAVERSFSGAQDARLLHEVKELFGGYEDLYGGYSDGDEDEDDEIAYDDDLGVDSAGNLGADLDNGETSLAKENPLSLAAIKRAQTARKPKKDALSLQKVFEPSILAEKFMTDKDMEIKAKDIPERYQLNHIARSIPTAAEITAEAKWIYQRLFKGGSELFMQQAAPPSSAIEKIEAVLTLMRVKHFDIPFISVYRRDYLLPELSLPDDLWRIMEYDELWIHVYTQRQKLEARLAALRKLHAYDLKNGKPALTPVSDYEDNLILGLDSFEDLKLANAYIEHKFAEDLERIALYRANPSSSTLSPASSGNQSLEAYEPSENARSSSSDALLSRTTSMLKSTSLSRQRSRNHHFIMAKEAGLLNFLSILALSSEKFGENLRVSVCTHEPDYPEKDPVALAQEYTENRYFTTAQSVIQASKKLALEELKLNPVVSTALRRLYITSVVANIRPTEEGVRIIDKNHPYFRFKYIKDKPLCEFDRDISLLHIFQAETEKLLALDLGLPSAEIGIEHTSFWKALKPCYIIDQYSSAGNQWNEIRQSILKEFLETHLFQRLNTEIRAKLKTHGLDLVSKLCAREFHEKVSVQPYINLYEAQHGVKKSTASKKIAHRLKETGSSSKSSKNKKPARPTQRKKKAPYFSSDEDSAYTTESSDSGDDNDDDDDQQEEEEFPAVFFGLHAAKTPAMATECAILDLEGKVLEHFALRNILSKNPNSQQRIADTETFKSYLAKFRPIFVGVSCEDFESVRLFKGLQRIVRQFNDEIKPVAPITIEYVDASLAKIYEDSEPAKKEFYAYSTNLRHCVSLMRRVIDPLAEFCHVLRTDAQFACFKVNSMQHFLSTETVREIFSRELVNTINASGLRICTLKDRRYYRGMLNYVSGFGPRKADRLLEELESYPSVINSRVIFARPEFLSSKIYANAIGFFIIHESFDSSIGHEPTLSYSLLDATRIHPESYNIAEKILASAFDTTETKARENLNNFIMAVRNDPSSIRSLELNAYAKELQAQNAGQFALRVHDIRDELINPYKDNRLLHKRMTTDEIFECVTGEDEYSFNVGFLVNGKVTAHKEKCIMIRLENNLHAQAFYSNLELRTAPIHAQSYNSMASATQSLGNQINAEYPVGRPVLCRVLRISKDAFSCDVSTRTRDLDDEHDQWSTIKDPYYDMLALSSEQHQAVSSRISRHQRAHEASAAAALAPGTVSNQPVSLRTRLITHPNFRNTTQEGLVAELMQMNVGEALIRPSQSKPNELVLSWHIWTGVIATISIREEEKTNESALGAVLLINNERYEDIDEILVRYVMPMSELVLDASQHRQWIDPMPKDGLLERLMGEKQTNPGQIPYHLSASLEHPGSLVLGYCPDTKPFLELVKLTPRGFVFRQKAFLKVDVLIAWFKFNCMNPSTIPRRPPAATASPPTSQQPLTAAHYQSLHPPSRQPQYPHHVPLIPAHQQHQQQQHMGGVGAGNHQHYHPVYAQQSAHSHPMAYAAGSGGYYPPRDGGASVARMHTGMGLQMPPSHQQPPPSQMYHHHSHGGYPNMPYNHPQQPQPPPSSSSNPALYPRRY